MYASSPRAIIRQAADWRNRLLASDTIRCESECYSRLHLSRACVSSAWGIAIANGVEGQEFRRLAFYCINASITPVPSADINTKSDLVK
jgi:hypothetical protein